MLKFLKRLGKSWWLVAVLFVCSVLKVIMDIALPTVMGLIINDIQTLTDAMQFYEIIKYSVAMAILAIMSGVFNIIVVYLASKITSDLIAKVRLELFSKINQFSLEEMNKFSVSSLITRTTNDLTQVNNTFNLGFKFLLYSPIMAITALIFMFRTGSWQLSLISLGAVLVLLILIIFLAKVVLPRYRSIQDKTDRVNLITRENLEGLRVVRAYNAEDLQESKFEAVNEDLTSTLKFSNRSLGLIVPSMQFIIGILSLLISWVGSYLINGSMLAYSDMTVFSQYAMLVLMGFLLIAVVLIMLPRSMVCAKRIMDVIECPIAVQEAKETPFTPEVGTIEFQDVSFSYPGAERPVIDHISFSAKKGTTLAFIGATGSGKSTIINLIPRFFDATEGKVIVDGVNVKDYKFEDLFLKVGYVPQKGYLFHESLRNNVCLGKPDATDEELAEALDIAEATDFVKKLPGGYEYEISQGGKNVSGGQRQRLSIARAVIVKPEIFIFDDSFSALDYKTDKVLRGKIKEKCPGVTNIIVAQRVGTIIDADQIIVLDEGKMVGKGTHQELLKDCAVYREIALSQLSKEELEKNNG